GVRLLRRRDPLVGTFVRAFDLLLVVLLTAATRHRLADEETDEADAGDGEDPHHNRDDVHDASLLNSVVPGSRQARQYTLPLKCRQCSAFETRRPAFCDTGGGPGTPAPQRSQAT